MQERNSAQAWATATKQAEDWSQYKRLRNRVTKNLKVDKYNWQKNKIILSEDQGQKRETDHDSRYAYFTYSQFGF